MARPGKEEGRMGEDARDRLKLLVGTESNRLGGIVAYPVINIYAEIHLNT